MQVWRHMQSREGQKFRAPGEFSRWKTLKMTHKNRAFQACFDRCEIKTYENSSKVWWIFALMQIKLAELVIKISSFFVLFCNFNGCPIPGQHFLPICMQKCSRCTEVIFWLCNARRTSLEAPYREDSNALNFIKIGDGHPNYFFTYL